MIKLEITYRNSMGGRTRLHTPGDMTFERMQQLVDRYRDDQDLIEIVVRITPAK